MAHGIEPVVYQQKEIAIIFRRDIAVTEIRFLTDPTNFFQVGIHDRKKSISLPAHMHNCPAPITIDEIHEVLYVITGKLRVTMLSKSNKVIAKKLLSKGDAILLKSQAHKVEFIGHTRVFEIKQGPYPGAAKAKKYIK